MNSFERLMDKIERAKELDFGTIFDRVITLFKKVYLKGFLMLLITVILAFAINMVFALIGLAPKNDFLINGFDIDSFYSFYALNVVYSIPQTILVTTITMALVSAFYRICKQVDLGETVVDDYFYFFNKSHFSKLLTLGMISTGITVLAQLLFIIPAIYVFVPLLYFSIIFANNPNLSEMEIIKASFILGNKKWFLTFGLVFVFGLLGALGIVLCVVGMLFTVPIIYLPVYFIYKEVIGFEETSEIDQIGKHDSII
ncbi:hypothetical protein [Cognatitamlana onchidii]|uniref:hypothetical protein n=1 Tax=Cognatitamlana onchidii TaxID=2562860 RepID=UPI0010A68154|nr:hypothetical protein [Algibacter onchidii]